MTDRIIRKLRRYGLPAAIVLFLGWAVIRADGGLEPPESRLQNVPMLHSSMDYNNNGTDDYTDFLLGAQKDAANCPEYDSRYWADGYPPESIGVCTDVVWRAFRQAGYSLRNMLDASVQANPEWYTAITKRDKNIDFRRVGNLRTFFDHYAISLTLDPERIEQWQPGDIVVFGEDMHIGIISDKRNEKGWAYVIHNGGQPEREEDFLGCMTITGHYRFDAAQVPDILQPFDGPTL